MTYCSSGIHGHCSSLGVVAVMLKMLAQEGHHLVESVRESRNIPDAEEEIPTPSESFRAGLLREDVLEIRIVSQCVDFDLRKLGRKVSPQGFSVGFQQLCESVQNERKVCRISLLLVVRFCW